MTNELNLIKDFFFWFGGARNRNAHLGQGLRLQSYLGGPCVEHWTIWRIGWKSITMVGAYNQPIETGSLVEGCFFNLWDRNDDWLHFL